MKKVFVQTIIPSLLLTALVVFCVLPISCKATVDGIQVLQGDFTVPAIENVLVSGSSTFALAFSKEVNLEQAELYHGEQIVQDSKCALLLPESESQKILDFKTEEPLTIGEKYTLRAVVSDNYGNTLTVQVPFKGYNDHPARLIFSEVKKYADVKNGKTEFVEFLCIQDGNLSDLEFFTAYSGEKSTYYFPPLEVKKGEYITLHLRTENTGKSATKIKGYANESAEDKTKSKTAESCDTAIDLWIEGTKAMIGNSDILVLQNNLGKIQDSLVYYTTSTEPNFTKYSKTVLNVEQSGFWVDQSGKNACSVESGVCVGKSFSANRSLSRKNCEEILQNGNLSQSSADDWIITDKITKQEVVYTKTGKVSSKTKTIIVTPAVTPGYANSTKEYVSQ